MSAPPQLPPPRLALRGRAREVVEPAWGLEAWALCRGAQVELCDPGVAWEMAPGTAEGAAVEVTACEDQVRLQAKCLHGVKSYTRLHTPLCFCVRLVTLMLVFYLACVCNMLPKRL